MKYHPALLQRRAVHAAPHERKIPNNWLGVNSTWLADDVASLSLLVRSLERRSRRDTAIASPKNSSPPNVVAAHLVSSPPYDTKSHTQHRGSQPFWSVLLIIIAASRMAQPQPRPPPRGAVVFLHGSGGNGGDLAWMLRASKFEDELQDLGLELICPTAAPRPYSYAGGAPMSVWFDRADLHPDAPEDEKGADDSYEAVGACAGRWGGGVYF